MVEKCEEILGCLGTWEEDTDYVLLDGDIDLLPELYQQDNIRYEYNQGNQSWSKVSCTIFAAVGMLSDLMNYEFSLKEIKEIDELSYNNPNYPHIRKKGEWWYVKYAVDLVAKRWNEKHGDLGKVTYYRISKYSDMVDKCLQKNYTLDTNFCPTVAYTRDYYLDCVLDGCEFGDKTNWHSVGVIRDWHRCIKDNYKGRKNADGTKDCNIYEVKNPLAKITNYGTYLYIYTKVAEDNMEEIKRLNEIKSKCNVIIDHLGELRGMVNQESFRAELHHMANRCRKKIDDANEQLKKYI